ncbi:MAG: cache domain-containing protein [Pseudanabaenaceae cyanobacterium]
MAERQRWLRGIPLRWLLVVPFTLQTLMAVGVVGYLSWSTGQRSVSDLVARLENEVGNRIVDNLHDFVETPHQINQTNVDLVRLGRISMANMEDWEKHLWLQVQRFPDINFVKITHADGRERTGEQLLDGSRTINVVDSYTEGHFHAYQADEQGNRTQLLVKVPGYDGRTYSFYTNAVQAQQPTWSGTYISLLEPTLLMSASQPIYDERQAVLGVASAALRLDGIGSFLRSLRVGKTGQAFIMERDGYLLATSAPESPFRLVPQTNNRSPERRRLLAQDSSDALTALASQTLAAERATLKSTRH